MLHSVYGAAATMQRAELQHELSARNLANAQVPGYRRTQMVQGTFDDSLLESVDELRERSTIINQTGLRGSKVSWDFTTGAIEQTGRSLDVTIDGAGFFVVESTSPDGTTEELYTRNGAFQLRGDGQLVTKDGRPVLGQGGPIQIDPSLSPTSIAIDPTGRILVNETALGQLRVVTFEDQQRLENVGTTLFRDPDNNPTDTHDARIAQGVLERSNVQPVRELVDLIAAQRRYDAAARSLRTLMKTVEQRINLQGGN